MKKNLLIIVALCMLVLTGCITPNAAVWKTIPEIQHTKYENAWPTIVGCVAGRNLNLELSDTGSGYLRTAYGSTGNNTQTRVIVRLVSKEPLQISLKAELIKLDVFNNRWIEVGNNVAMEKVILDELAARLK